MSDHTSSNTIFFWNATGEYGEFSNWFPCSFVIDGQKYCHVEQYMMAEKARRFDDMDSCKKILSTEDPAVCKKLGKKVKNYDDKSWNDVRYDVVFQGCRAKFRQNPKLEKLLLSTGEAKLAEASPYDAVWGIGLTAGQAAEMDPKDWEGRNLLGKVLMELREELREKEALNRERVYVAYDLKKICKFADKQMARLSDPALKYYQLADETFGKECQALGFEMDCAHRFINRYSGKTFSDAKELMKVINDISDIRILASGIFSRWRDYNHWEAGWGTNGMAEPNVRIWFILALFRLKVLAQNRQDNTLLAYQFKNQAFGTYNVLLHCSEGITEEMLNCFPERMKPDLVPKSKDYPDLYLFLLDTEKKIITPMWSYRYAYGGLYNGYGPISEEIRHFRFDLNEYSYEHFTEFDKSLIQANNLPRDRWPDVEAAIFRDRKDRD